MDRVDLVGERYFVHRLSADVVAARLVMQLDGQLLHGFLRLASDSVEVIAGGESLLDAPPEPYEVVRQGPECVVDLLRLLSCQLRHGVRSFLFGRMEVTH